MATEVDAENQGIGFGIKQAAVPTAALLAGLAVPLIGVEVSWRWVFAAAALVAVLAYAVTPAYEPRRNNTSRVSAPLRGALLWLALVGVLAGGGGNAVANFLVDAAVDVGFGEVGAAQLLTVAALAAVAVRVLAGWLVDRSPGDGDLTLVSMLGIGIAGCILLAAGDGMLLFSVGAVLAFCGAWGWPGVMYYHVVRTVQYPAAAATGAVLAGTYIGSVLLPPVVGLVAETATYTAAFTLAAVALGGGAACFAMSRRSRQRQEAAAS